MLDQVDQKVIPENMMFKQSSKEWKVVSTVKGGGARRNMAARGMAYAKVLRQEVPQCI